MHLLTKVRSGMGFEYDAVIILNLDDVRVY